MSSYYGYNSTFKPSNPYASGYASYFGKNPTASGPSQPGAGYVSPYVSDPTYGASVAASGGQYATTPPPSGTGTQTAPTTSQRPAIDFSHIDYSNDPIL